jgi:hypothetical protein
LPTEKEKKQDNMIRAFITSVYDEHHDEPGRKKEFKDEKEMLEACFEIAMLSQEDELIVSRNPSHKYHDREDMKWEKKMHDMLLDCDYMVKIYDDYNE